jgi:hypothetical protein
MKKREAEEKTACPNLRAKLELVPNTPGNSSINSYHDNSIQNIPINNISMNNINEEKSEKKETT